MECETEFDRFKVAARRDKIAVKHVIPIVRSIFPFFSSVNLNCFFGYLTKKKKKKNLFFF